jgi:hypothetical protein
VERRRRVGPADVLLDEVDVRDRDEDLRAPLVLDRDEILLAPVPLEPLEAEEPPDAVGEMDDRVALLELEERVDRPRARAPRRRAPHAVAVEELVI